MITVIAIVATFTTSVQLIPQTISAFDKKKRKGISLTTYLMVTFSATLWLTYGFMRNDLAIILTNLFVLICAVITVLLKLQPSKK
jgi:MtN3 and saliva related transmembrane protein